MNVTANKPVIPVLPNNVADALSSYRADHSNDKHVITCALNKGAVTERQAAIQSIPFDTLLAALVNGYEREQTAEQRAHDQIRHCYRWRCDSGEYDRGYRNGAKMVLGHLGVDIPEVTS